DPYSVNIWVVGIGPSLFVHAGANRAEWVVHIEANPDVRLRVDETIYELTAARVTDAGEFARFSDAYERKYDRRPRNENVDEAYLFRLGPRG
ncbi:MAG: nitroreductase/quinone reductase family protein, partial [Gammaproteobacteria bacterium]